MRSLFDFRLVGTWYLWTNKIMKGETSIYVITVIIILAIIGGIFWWASASSGSLSSATATSSDELAALSASIGTTT